MKKGEVALFDKASNNYVLFDTWNTDRIFFVTRLKKNAKETRLGEFYLQDATPDNTLRDAKIALKDKGDDGLEKQVELRFVSFYHEEKIKFTIFYPIYLIYLRNK
jgi:hypothetical protein